MNALSWFLWHTAALANSVRQTPLENPLGHPSLPPNQSAHLASAAKNGRPMTPPTALQSLRIFCLCAHWCVICREFEPAFQRLATGHPDHRWQSLDIEDHEALLADIDIENFPTVVILNPAQQVCFAGTIEPRIDGLQRLVQAAQAGDLHLSDDRAQAWQVLTTL